MLHWLRNKLFPRVKQAKPSTPAPKAIADPWEIDGPAVLPFPRSAVYGRMPGTDQHSQDELPPLRIHRPADRVARALAALRDDGLADGAGI